MTERPTESTWVYFNGDMHGWNDAKGYHAPKPMTLAYCWSCGPKHIPGFKRDDNNWGAAHYYTDFRCAPWTVGRACDGCGKGI